MTRSPLDFAASSGAAELVGAINTNLLVVAEPGSGARAFVLGYVSNVLAAGEPVRILESERNYAPFCRLMGGVLWQAQTSPRGIAAFTRPDPVPNRYTAQLQLYDFSGDGVMWAQLLPAAKDIPAFPPGVLVIENLKEVAERFPLLEDLMAKHARVGGRFCLVDSSEAAFEPWREFVEPYGVRRFMAPSE